MRSCKGSEEPADARVHAAVAVIRRASLIKSNYVCRVIARLIESRDSAAIPSGRRRKASARGRKMERHAAARNRHFARTRVLYYVSLIPSYVARHVLRMRTGRDRDDAVVSAALIKRRS